MILVIFNRKWTFWTTFLRTSNSLLSKSHDISAFNPMDPPQNLLKPSQNPYFDHFDPFEGPVRLDIRPNKMALFSIWCEMDTKWCKYAKTYSQPFKVAFVQIEVQNHHFTLLTPCFGPLFLTSRTKMLICSALIDGPQNRPKTLKTHL